MRLNRKGFTLIELLVTIIIIGLIISFSVYGIVHAINKTKDKKLEISLSSIKESAREYSSEFGSGSWRSDDDNYESFCVTVGELINKGLLGKDIILDNNVNEDTFVIVKRNKVTLVTIKEEITEPGDDNYYFCTNQEVDESEEIIKPKIISSTNYTDKIEVSFQNGSATHNGSSSEVTYKCLYGDISSNVNMEGVIADNKCIVDNLKNNKVYYIIVYMNTKKGSSVAADGPIAYTTSDFIKPTFNSNLNVVTISYNDNDNNGIPVNSPSHYFRSTIDATTNIGLKKCVVNGNSFDCDENNTTKIEKDTWYKVSANTINVIYPYNNSITLNSRTYDKANNYIENSGTFSVTSKVNISFSASGGTITEVTDGRSWNTVDDIIYVNNKKYYFTIHYGGDTGIDGLPNYNNSKFINITRTGYKAQSGEEWKCISDSCKDRIYDHSVLYPASDFCDATNGECEVTLAVNWKPNTYTVTLDNQGASSGGTSKIYGKYDDGIYLGSDYTSIMTTSTNKITIPTKIGYTFEGYYTEKDGAGIQMISNTGYLTNNFTNTTYTSSVTLYAKWRINRVHIYYSVNGGTITQTTDGGTWSAVNDIVYRNGNPFYQNITYGQEDIDPCNYNNTKYINITRSGYTTNSGEEWICISDSCSVKGKIYNHNAKYLASDFCDSSNSDCDVTLAVNWKNYYTITYNANGGNTNTIPSAQTATSGISTKLSTIIPTRSNYIFTGWNTKSNGSGTKYTSGATYSGNTSVTLYAQWQYHVSHIWDATGNTLFQLYESEKFTCNKYHQYGYARYCSVCGMSVRYYRSKVDTSSTSANWWCPCKATSNTNINVYFNDESLKSSDAKTGRDNVENRCGLTCGQTLFSRESSVTSICTEH